DFDHGGERHDAVLEDVVDGDAGDGDDEAGGGGDERLGNRVGKDAGPALITVEGHDPEGLDHADDGAEQSEQRRDRSNDRERIDPREMTADVASGDVAGGLVDD